MDQQIDFLKNKMLYINNRIMYVNKQKILPIAKNNKIRELKRLKNEINEKLSILSNKNEINIPINIFNTHKEEEYDEKPNYIRFKMPTEYHLNIDNKSNDISHQTYNDIVETSDFSCQTYNDVETSDFSCQTCNDVETNDSVCQTEIEYEVPTNKYSLLSKKNIDIIISSTQYPGMGGAATNAYNIIKKLRCDGFRVLGIFINNEEVDVDPDRIGDVVNILNKQFQTDYVKKLNNYKIKDDVLILAKNYRAPYLFRDIYPNSKIVYMVAGVVSYSLYIRSNNIVPFTDFYQKCNDYRKLLMNQNKNNSQLIQENRTIKACDYVMTNSSLTYETYSKHFSDKNILDVMNTSILNFHSNNLVEKKTNDLLYVVSSHRRVIKNSDFIFELFRHPALKNFNKIIVGKYHEDFNKFGIENCNYYGFIDNKYVLKLMKQSKLLVIPSFNDSSPNVLYEALFNNCQILISKNIGNWELFQDHIPICDNPIKENVNNWVKNTLDIILRNKKVPQRFMKLYQIQQEYNFKKFIIENI